MVTTPLNIAAVDFKNEAEVSAFYEALFDLGRAKVLDDFRRLREMGIVDEHGNQLKTPIPADMLDDAAEFGG